MTFRLPAGRSLGNRDIGTGGRSGTHDARPTRVAQAPPGSGAARLGRRPRRQWRSGPHGSGANGQAHPERQVTRNALLVTSKPLPREQVTVAVEGPGLVLVPTFHVQETVPDAGAVTSVFRPAAVDTVPEA